MHTFIISRYNVGSIELKFDSMLKTNQITRDYTCPNLEYPYPFWCWNFNFDLHKYFSWNGVGSYAYERDYRAEHGVDIVAEKGDECGQFHFGSTVVLIFEASNFHFDIQPGTFLLFPLLSSSFTSSFSLLYPPSSILY